MKLNNFLKLVISIFIAELAGVIGSVFTVPSISDWYSTLRKPEVFPPNWIFGPAWTTLYLLMGISAFLIWKTTAPDEVPSKGGNGLEKKNSKIALFVFYFQLILNIFWSVIFFGLHNPAAALVEIIILWLMIILTIFLFYKISKTSAYLLLPYIFWVTFAIYLNYFIFILN